MGKGGVEERRAGAGKAEGLPTGARATRAGAGPPLPRVSPDPAARPRGRGSGRGDALRQGNYPRATDRETPTPHLKRDSSPAPLSSSSSSNNYKSNKSP